MLWKWEKYFWKDLITFLCNNFVAVCLRLKVVWVWPPLQAVPVGPPHTPVQLEHLSSVHQLCAQQTQRPEVTGSSLYKRIHLFLSSHLQCVCNSVSSDFQTGPNLSTRFPVGLQSHPPHLAGARSETPQVWSQLNITSLFFNAFINQHLFSILAWLYFLI